MPSRSGTTAWVADIRITRTPGEGRVAAFIGVATLVEYSLGCHAGIDELLFAGRRVGERGVRRAPVVDRHGSLVGIISIDDLLPRLAAELGSLAELMRFQ